MLSLFKEFLHFLGREKKWWLISLALMMLLLGALLLATGSSGISWALYPSK